MITDHQSLKDLNTKAELPARIMRFLDVMQHYGGRVFYRFGKANILANYLSKPLEEVFAANKKVANPKPIKKPEKLNRVDLQAIFKHITYNQPLPQILNHNWIYTYFAVYNNELQKISKFDREHGDPLHSGGLTTKAIIMLRIPEYGELHQEARNSYYALGHGSAGATKRKMAITYWHSELTLAVQQAIIKCPQYQLMKRPDPTLLNLVPIKPPPSLTQ
jgi:hypothetical protein